MYARLASAERMTKRHYEVSLKCASGSAIKLNGPTVSDTPTAVDLFIETLDTATHLTATIGAVTQFIDTAAAFDTLSCCCVESNANAAWTEKDDCS